VTTSRRHHPAFRKIRAAVRSGGLVQPGETVLAACSGGPDSTALLHLLLELGRDIPFSLAVAHFNHRLRPQAAADERFVRDAALKLDLPFYAGRGDVRAASRKLGIGIEEAGRRLRYEFLERAAAEAGAAKIATGHTLNDQAETVLMRLLRGTGPSGLAGIPAVRDGSIIRPLLGLSRGEILAYLHDRQLAWRTDSSNRDERILRNKIRRKLIPYLEKDFSPAVVRSLARLASISRDEDDFLEEKARSAASKAMAKKGQELFLDAKTLTRLHPALARRVVRLFLRSLKGDLLDISFDDVEAIRGMAPGGELPISKALILERRQNRLGRRKGAVSSVRYACLWDGRGRLPVPEAGRTYSGRFVKAPAVRSLVGSVSMAGTRRKHRFPDDAAGCFLDAARLEFPLLVRNRRPGDRYRPLGAPGGKKLKEIFRAKGVAEEERDRRPVFVSGGEVVWVQGLPAAENHKITFRTQKALAISAAPSRKRSPEKDDHGGEKK